MNKGDLPKEWLYTDLDNVLLKIVGGGTPSKSNSGYYSGSIPWMSVKDMNKNNLSDTVDHISQEAVENSSTNIIPAGTPIVATRMSLGKIVVASFDSAINQDLKALFLSEDINKDYFINWYRSIARDIEQLGTGTTVKGIRLEVLNTLSFPLAPLAEQHEIAKTLDELLAQVDRLKARLDTIPSILKRFRQSVLAAAVSGKLTEDWRKLNTSSIPQNLNDICFNERFNVFGKKAKKPKNIENTPKVDMPIGWAWTSIDSICLKITDGTHHSPASFPTGDYKYVTSKNVREGYIDLSNISYVDKDTHKEIYSRCDVVFGDVLYVKDGANTGLACVSNIKEQVSLLSSVGVLRPNSLVNGKYFQNYLNSPIGRKLMLGMMGGTAIPRLTLTKLMHSPFPLAPIKEQAEIVHRVDQLFAYADQIEQRVKDAQTRVNSLTQSILAKAFRGELTAEWREQNPDLISGENSAAALLDRIKAERAVQANAKKPRGKAKASAS